MIKEVERNDISKPSVIVKYDYGWPRLFEKEANADTLFYWQLH